MTKTKAQHDGAKWRCLNRLVRRVGLTLVKCGIAKRYCETRDTRKEDGKYWETFGWELWGLRIPFSKPRRNSLMEMTTPQVLKMWEKLK